MHTEHTPWNGGAYRQATPELDGFGLPMEVQSVSQ
jgi:hypothetical protein